MTNAILVCSAVVLSACEPAGSAVTVYYPDAGSTVETGSSTDPADRPVIDGGLAVDAAIAVDATTAVITADAAIGNITPDAAPPPPPLPPSCASRVPAGFARRATPTRFTEVPSMNFPGYYLNDFPLTGFGLGVVLAKANQYVAIAFTPPSDPALYQGISHTFGWYESQVGGEANAGKIYASISDCPGDLRVPTSYEAPANDPTLRYGCRNWYSPTQVGLGIRYSINGILPPEVYACPLEPGRTYYFNVAMVNPNDGIAPGELNCLSSWLTECGIAMEVD